LAGQIDEATGKLKIINVLKGQIQELKQNQEVKLKITKSAIISPTTLPSCRCQIAISQNKSECHHVLNSTRIHPTPFDPHFGGQTHPKPIVSILENLTHWLGVAR
jgi:hypothetical protein